MSRNIAIIGSGAIGSTSAIELLRAGHRVTVIESATPGGTQASSYGNAGWLSCQSVIPPATPGTWKKVPGYLMDPLGPLSVRWPYLPRTAGWLLRYVRSGWTYGQILDTAKVLRPLLKDPVELHAGLAAEAGVPQLIAAGGVLHVFPDRDAYAGDRKLWDIRAEVGIGWRELEGPALRAAYPALPARYGFALEVEGAGRCRNPGAYVAALAGLAQARGAVYESAAAKDFRFEGGRLAAVVTDRGEVACDGAVVAAGVRSAALSARLGDPVPLESERGYHVMVKGGETGLVGSFMASDAKVVVQQMESGVRVAGQVEIASTDAPADWRRAEILRAHLARMFPRLDVAAGEPWLGHRPSTPDGRPCIGVSRRTRDVVYAFGHGHVGLVSAPRTARAVTALLSGRAPEIPLAGMDAARFF